MEPAAMSAGQLVEAYAARELSPVEVADTLAAEIERRDPDVGAFAALCLDRARDEARAAEAAYAGGGAGPRPLEGVPFAAKDAFDSEGVATAYGSPMFAGHVPDRDAALVGAARDAGGLLVGKTRTHEFAWGITTINEAMGSPRNPWDPSLVTGGSSGGSAAALAADFVPLTLGTDTGGSIRIPAAFCGVAGLKPTYGRLDKSGVWPLAPSLDHAGPMARTPGDLELVLAAVEGRHAEPPPAALDGATVVACPDLHPVTPAPDIARVYAETLERLEHLGARVVERALPEAATAFETFRAIQGGEAARVHRDAGLFPERAAEYGRDVRANLEYAQTVDLAAYAAATAERERLRAGLGRIMAGGALLVTLVSAVPPAPAADPKAAGRAFRANVMPFTVAHDLAGIPACAVRAGFDASGLPVSVQIAAAPWRDRDVLRAARALCHATPEIQARLPAR